MLSTLTELSNKDLIANLLRLKDLENITLADIILYLYEVDSRQLYRDLGYSSLYSYCTGALNYSESAAYRRILAARSLKRNPEIYDTIRAGKLSLCAVAEIVRVKEQKAKEALFKSCEGKTRREVQVLTAQHEAPSKRKREVIRAKRTLVPASMSLFEQQPAQAETQETFSISIEVDKEFMELLNEAKALAGHMPTQEVFKRTLKEYVVRRKSTTRKVSPSKAKNKRFVPKSAKVAVRNRDKGQCTFVSPDGKHCCEKHSLEFDHILPTSAGGSTDFNNLRLTCRAHNQLYAERFFGREKMLQYRGGTA